MRLDGQPVGRLVETETGSCFCYEPTWLAQPHAVPVSLTLPLTDQPYEQAGLHPFFANLLPEGWLLELSVARLKISRDDAFGLLLATCADCIGAVEIIADD